MTIKEIIETNNTELFRNRDWSKDDIAFIKDKLEIKSINWIDRYLKVSKELPPELLTPLLKSGLKDKNICYPLFWMDSLRRIYSIEKIDRNLFSIISNGSKITKCKATDLFYYNNIGTTTRNNIELRESYIWNGKNYIKEKFVASDFYKNEKQERIKLYLEQRYKFLIEEFLNTDCIIYRYHIYLVIRKIVNHPISTSKNAKKVIEIFSQNKFPKNASDLLNLAKLDNSLNELIEKLKY